MSTTKEDFKGVKDEARDKLSNDMAELRSSFTKLRSDVTTLLSDALGAGKTVGRTGASAVKDQASDAVDTVKQRVKDWEERGSESVDALGEKIGEHPVTSALIALGVGFILAKLLTRK
jgi:ElaB/YqjD/DUF883 family membrane-anchored ribosome-binding protein